MNSNTAISLASAVVATAALFISIWNAWATRRHNRLSVRPHLALSKKTSPNAPQLTIDIKNNGLGPAIMTSIRVFVDDIDQSLTRAAQWQDIVAKLRIFGGMITGYAMLGAEALRPGDTRLLVSINDPTKIHDVQTIQAETTRLRIVVEYSSMYGDKFKETLGK
jgi:hypothetical protein